MNKINKISSLIYLSLFLFSCYSSPKTYDIIKIESKDIINPIPIRIIENSNSGNLNITASAMINNNTEYNYKMFNVITGDTLSSSSSSNDIQNCNLKTPDKITIFDIDYQFTTNSNLFMGFQNYRINNKTENAYYLGYGYQKKYLNSGIRLDFYYYNHNYHYETNMITYEVEEGEIANCDWWDDCTNYNYSIKDTLSYTNSINADNVLASFTINLYEYNVFFNFSETPYFSTSFKAPENEEYKIDEKINIYRKIYTTFSFGFYKEINNLNTILGISMPSMLLKQADYIKKLDYFIQLSLKIN